jgi:hypothetical protein
MFWTEVLAARFLRGIDIQDILTEDTEDTEAKNNHVYGHMTSVRHHMAHGT